MVDLMVVEKYGNLYSRENYSDQFVVLRGTIDCAATVTRWRAINLRCVANCTLKIRLKMVPSAIIKLTSITDRSRERNDAVNRSNSNYHLPMSFAALRNDCATTVVEHSDRCASRRLWSERFWRRNRMALTYFEFARMSTVSLRIALASDATCSIVAKRTQSTPQLTPSRLELRSATQSSACRDHIRAPVSPTSSATGLRTVQNT